MQHTTSESGTAFPFVFQIAAGESAPNGSIADAPQRHIHYGMSYRDYLGAAALPACITAFMTSGGAWDDYNDMAESLWRIVDAVLRARAQPEAQAPGDVQARHLATFGEGHKP